MVKVDYNSLTLTLAITVNVILFTFLFYNIYLEGNISNNTIY